MEIVPVIPALQVVDATWSAQDMEFVSEILAIVINSLVGEALFVKCPDVQALTEKTAVEMENVTVQTISVSVYQGGRVLGVTSRIAPVFQTVLVVVTVTQLIA